MSLPAAPEVESPVDSPPEPDGDLVAGVVVKEIRIAEAKDFIDFHARFPRRWDRYVVRFEVTKVLKGRFTKPELSVLVHSPSLELPVRDEGQRGVLHGHHSGAYRFVPTESRRRVGSSSSIVTNAAAPVQ